MQEGSFVCIIGDVASGKSSLLHAIIGDLIHVPDEEVANMGGFNKEVPDNAINNMRKRLLAPDFSIERAPVEIAGDISYVE